MGEMGFKGRQEVLSNATVDLSVSGRFGATERRLFSVSGTTLLTMEWE
jgi:hypothetical protein